MHGISAGGTAGGWGHCSKASEEGLAALSSRLTPSPIPHRQTPRDVLSVVTLGWRRPPCACAASESSLLTHLRFPTTRAMGWGSEYEMVSSSSVEPGPS
jgi:hypothetical protein